jgi:hypothetical protein
VHAKGFERLVERARSAGVVRRDLSVEDVRTGLMAISSFRTLPPETAATAVRRLADLLLAGMAAPRA